MIIPYDKRVSPIPAVTGFKLTTDYYRTATPDGLPGSSLMTFFAVATYKRYFNFTDCLFSRGDGSLGFYIQSTGNGLRILVANGAGVTVISNDFVISGMVNIPLVIIARYSNGTIQFWVNGVSVAAITTGVGYTPAVAATNIGGYAVGLQAATDWIVHEAGVLDTYDVVASYNTAFGTSAPGLTAQWQEDLQQGRYLTCPNNGGVWGATSEYWSARDALLGGTGVTRATWLDRSTNAFSMSRFGTIQPAQSMARF